ncbi:MAG TPA: hypothetical protein VF173_19800 [Thermoanaerobaculia bacterium]|nr:hypothetical protein [Thermoanaerobaculia bacterium]
MSHREHPGPDVLLRFLRGEAALAESSTVVRHLLTGCRECLAVTRPVWELAEQKPEPLAIYQRKGSSRTGRMEASR